MKPAVLILASLIPIAACVEDEPIDTDTNDIVNGDPIPESQLPFVGMVRFPTLQGTGICSGSLLNDRVVLTAAHCVPDDRDVTGIEFTTSTSYTSATWTKVTDLRVQYFWPGNQMTMVKGDVALLRLEKPLPRPIYPVLLADASQLRTELSNGQLSPLTVAGYGLNTPQLTGLGIKRAGVVSFYAWVSTQQQLSATVPDDFQAVLHMPADPQQVCGGDSGGPALLPTAGGPVLTGVAHAVAYPQGQSPCHQDNFGFYSSVLPYRAWILAKTAELTGVFGDLDGNGRVDTGDLDEFGIGLRRGVNDPVYDIDNDGDVDMADGNEMVFRRVGILYGDIDGDGTVDGGDFLTWQRHLGKTTGKWTDADMNFDGKTDSLDLDAWKANYGRKLSTSSAEPSGLSSQ